MKRTFWMRAFTTIGVLTWLAAIAVAQTPPERERGFDAQKVYQFNGLDSINVYNGNLNLTLPLASYSVSADVSYAFTLHYSGITWRSMQECSVGGGTPPEEPVCEVLFYPQNDNAGLGWRLSFGELEVGDDWPLDPNAVPSDVHRYLSPDGGEHYFYDTLHEPRCASGVTTNCDPVTAGVQYTRDGTYLRLKIDGTVKIVEFPNGMRHRYEVSNPIVGYHKLKYIYGASSTLDSNGIPTTNYVKFEDQPSGSNDFAPDLKVSDSHGRQHLVSLKFFSETGPVPDYVELAAVARSDDEQGTTPKARFDFVYDNASSTTDGDPTTIVQPCSSNLAESENTARRFLRRIDNEETDETWEFQYYQPSGESCQNDSGVLIRAILPTGGRINWSYQDTPFPGLGTTVGLRARCLRRDDLPCSTNIHPSQQDEFVLYTIDGNAGTTTLDTYGRRANGDWGVDSRAVHYFSQVYETAGLPFGAILDETGRGLSVADYDCSVETSICSTSLLRRRYLKYELDSLAGVPCGPTAACLRHRNSRVVSERSQSLSGGTILDTLDTNHTAFDGLGHYRQTTTIDVTGNGGTRVNYTGYNENTRALTPANCGGSSGVQCSGSSVGTYAVTAGGNRIPGFTMLGADDSWILGTHSTSYSRLTNSSGTTTAHAEACFDPRTGFLQRTRAKRLESGLNDPHDLLTIYTRDSATGYASREEWFGGDKHNLDVSALCSMPLPAHDDYSYRRDHTYSYGALQSSRYMNGSSPLSFYTVDHTLIDPNTGLVRETRDASGLTTAFEYDRAGRLTSVTPPGAAPTTYAYSPKSTTSPAAVDVETNASAGIVRSRFEFDMYGRMVKTKTLLPSETTAAPSSWSDVDVAYDHAGRKKKVSEPYVAGVDTPVYTTFDYDLFGRTTRVLTPDEKESLRTYTGARQVTRTSEVEAINGPATAEVKELYDGFGQLVQVQERSGPSDGLVTTTYRYDVGGRLGNVEMTGAESGAPVQARSFVYDRLGLLREEDHPESERVYYTDYDARGHARLKVLEDPALSALKTTPHDLRFTFDKAERLTKVEAQQFESPATRVFRDLKRFIYGETNGVFNGETSYANGKLLTAIRWNYYPDPQYAMDEVFRVTETYAYADDAGRKTDRTTIIERLTLGDPDYSLVRSITQNVEHNDLGLPSRINYPSCVQCLYSPTKALQSTYSAGKLRQLDRILDDSSNTVARVADVAYWPNGMMKSVKHGNEIIDSVTTDSGMARPKQITFATVTECVKPSWITVTATPSYPVSSGQTVTLTAAVGPPNVKTPIQYQWLAQDEEGLWLPLGYPTSSPSINVAPAGTTNYKVLASNACHFAESGSTELPGSVAEAFMTVTVADCEPPAIISQPAGKTIQPGASVSLSVTATGTSPFSYAWYEVNNPTVVLGTAQTLTLSNVLQTARYACRVTNGCGELTSQEAEVTVPLAAPSTLSATYTSGQGIVLSWSSVPSAHHYKLERMSPNGTFTSLPNASGTTYTDATASAGVTYVYRVFAVDANGGSTSQPSPRDLATAMTFTNVVAGGAIDDAHFHELLTALNALHAANGWASVTWSAILPAGLPAPGPTAGIHAAHLAALRDKLNFARQSLGVAAGAYADEPLQTTTAIRALHITALQQRAQ